MNIDYDSNRCERATAHKELFLQRATGSCSANHLFLAIGSVYKSWVHIVH